MDFLHANPDDIVGTIRALLTGDRGIDIPFVQQQKKNYEAHPDADIIVAELDRMLSEFKARAEFEAILLQQRRRCDGVVREASAALKQGDLGRAEQLLRGVVEHDATVSDWRVAWYDFQDPIERLYVQACAEERGEMRETPLPLVGVQQLLCAVLLAAERPQEALQAIDAAIAMNKVAVMPRLERSYCLQRLGRWSELHHDLMEAFELCWTQMHFAQWYRSLAPWYFNAADYAGFGACLQLSLACVEDESVRHLLEAAEPLADVAFDEAFTENVPVLARERGIPVQPSPIWYDLAMRLARQTLEDEAFEQALRYLTVAYDIKRSPELLAQVERLRAHLQTLEVSTK